MSVQRVSLGRTGSVQLPYLGICEKELDRCQNTEYAEDYEKPPLDVDEGRRNEETDGEVE